MNIYTSYFAKTKALVKAGIVPIGVAQFPPNWYTGFSERTLAPSKRLLEQIKKDQISWKRFETLYKQQLLTLSPARTLEILKKLSGGKDIALCCFEKDVEECHRKFLGQWISKFMQMEVTEFVDPQENENNKKQRISREKDSQVKLF